MTIDLDKLQEMWERDSNIDRDNLHEESLKIPSLHAKYFELYNTMLVYIESILKVIQNRTYQIKNAIEFMRFQSGLG